MSCGGSKKSNANAAAISDGVTCANAAVGQAAARTPSPKQQARKQEAADARNEIMRGSLNDGAMSTISRASDAKILKARQAIHKVSQKEFEPNGWNGSAERSVSSILEDELGMDVLDADDAARAIVEGWSSSGRPIWFSDEG